MRSSLPFTHLAFGLILLALLAGCEKEKPTNGDASAEVPSLEKTVSKGPVELAWRLTPKEPRLSDMLTLEITVRSPADVDVTPPPFGKAVGEFLVRDYVERPMQIENDIRVRRFRYKLEPVRTGVHLIRSLGVEFVDRRKDAADKTKLDPVFLETDPIEITVSSQLGDGAPSLTQLAPMSTPVPLPARALSVWIIAIIAGVACSGAGLAVAWRMRRKKHESLAIQKSPEEIAREELTALLAENLPARGLHKEFYLRITGIVRRYIEQTTGIHAPEQTTEEFLRDKRFKEVFPFERAQQLAHFLEAADLVKYAGMQPGQRQLEESVSRAQEFVGLSSAFAPLPAGKG